MDSTREPLIPVLVDAAGRSGTTAMMQLLASSAAVVTERAHPYESRYLTYLYSWSKMLDGCPDAAANWERGKLLPGPADEIGGLPWRELLPDPSGFASKCFLAAWGQFSHGAPVGGTHYIEKVPRWISEAVPSVLLKTRVIHLVRDPRDVWLSISGFNTKRGFLGFGRKENQQEEEFFADFVAAQRKRLEPLVGGSLREGERLVRYESLMSDPGRTVSDLGGWLGLELDPGALALREGRHATSSNAADSVERWRRELPKAWRSRFGAAFGDLLEPLGFSLE